MSSTSDMWNHLLTKKYTATILAMRRAWHGGPHPRCVKLGKQNGFGISHNGAPKPWLIGYDSKGWMRVLARLRTISLQVSILRGSPENVLFPESLSDKKPGNAAGDGWKIRRSRVLTGWLSFAD